MCAGVLGRQRHHVAFHRGVHRGEAFRTACGDKLAHIIHHQRIAAAVTGKADWHNELPKPPFDYDLRSRHAALLGGSGDYLCTKQQELDDITRFMRSWRD